MNHEKCINICPKRINTNARKNVSPPTKVNHIVQKLHEKWCIWRNIHQALLLT